MKGKFIVIEGTDGSGKTTQFNLLTDRLTKEGYDVVTFDFPQYGQPSAFFIERYLNGKYGSAEAVGPYRGSLFYAMDRYEASFAIREALEAGKVVISNRYVGSNMAHQGGKIDDTAERKRYFDWLDELEFKLLSIARPDLNLVLHVPAAIAQELVDHKTERTYLESGKRDMHEADLGHLRNAEKVYLEICQMFPKTFTHLSCIENNKLKSIEAVAEDVWAKVEPIIKEGV